MKEKNSKIKRYRFDLYGYNGNPEKMNMDVFAPDIQTAYLIIKEFNKKKEFTYQYISSKRTGYLYNTKLEDLDPYEIVKVQLECIKTWDIEELTSNQFDDKYPKWTETINGKYDNLPRKRFIIFNGRGLYSAIDNRSGDCWCEDFLFRTNAIKYLFG